MNQFLVPLDRPLQRAARRGEAARGAGRSRPARRLQPGGRVSAHSAWTPRAGPAAFLASHSVRGLQTGARPGSPARRFLDVARVAGKASSRRTRPCPGLGFAPRPPGAQKARPKGSRLRRLGPPGPVWPIPCAPLGLGVLPEPPVPPRAYLQDPTEVGKIRPRRRARKVRGVPES